MKKSIVAKIMSIFLLLLVVYMVGSGLNLSNASKISGNVAELEDVFVQIRVEQKELVGSIETVKLYCNMIATSSSKPSADRMAENMDGELALLAERIAAMEALCGKISDREVLNAFQVYHEKINMLAEIGKSVADTYNAGNVEEAAIIHGGMYGTTMKVDEACEAFEVVLVEAQKANSGEIATSITTLRSVVVIMAVVFVVGVVLGGIYET